MKNIISYIKISLFVGVFSSCSITKKVPENAFLLRENIVLENQKKTKNPDVLNYLQQTPNTWFLGVPLWILMYNMADENSLENYQKWLEKNPKTHKILTKILSEKQVKRLGESFLVSGKDRFLQQMGEKTILLDTLLTKKTANILTAYYNSNGYFNAQTSYEIQPLRRKKQASVVYKVKTGKPYFVDSLSVEIKSPQLDSVYNAHILERIIQPNQPYSLTNFAQERSRLNNLFRNNGFYNFQQSAVHFEIERDTTSATTNYKINVRTKIDNYTDRDTENQQVKPYEIYKINKVNVYTDYDFSGNHQKYDSIQYKNLTIFYKNKLRFNQKMLFDAVAIRTGDIYSDENRSNTYKQLSNLRVFRYPNIQYLHLPDLKNTLDANVFLSPLPRFSLEMNMDITRSNIQVFGIGGGASFLARNVFKGAEILDFSVRANIGAQQLLDDKTHFFNVSEYGSDIRLTIPRIWFFLKTDKIIPQTMTPQTMLQFGFTSQKNIGLDRNKIQGVLRYLWNPKTSNQAILELLDVEYTRNINPEKFFSVYKNSYNYINQIAQNYKVPEFYFDNDRNLSIPYGVFRFIVEAISGGFPISVEEFVGMRNIIERYHQLTRNDLIMATSFSYIHNNTLLYNQPNMNKFRVKVETAGNIPNAISEFVKLRKNERDEKELLGVGYAQYIKTETEYIKHWDLGNKNVLAFRFFSGIAIPYGNAKNIPLSRSFFGGGSNDNRAWRAYSLGPGSSNSPLEFNEANFKIATNLEYRFPINGAFSGAIFADAGNIWNVFNDVTYSELVLDKLSDIQDIAIGTGFGLRYDFNYFILRFDLGFKTYDPSKPMQNRWIKDISLQGTTFNIGINYPF